MNDDLQKQINEKFPGYNQLALEARLKGMLVGHVAFAVPSGEFLHCPFQMNRGDATSAAALKLMLHQAVEELLRRGISMGRKQ